MQNPLHWLEAVGDSYLHLVLWLPLPSCMDALCISNIPMQQPWSQSALPPPPLSTDLLRLLPPLCSKHNSNSSTDKQPWFLIYPPLSHENSLRHIRRAFFVHAELRKICVHILQH